MAKIAYKYCIVPMCNNTTVTTPTKVFITLPGGNEKNIKRRQAWLIAIRRTPTDLSNQTVAYLCEDHFNLEEDVENYIKFKYARGPIRIKSTVVPHIFKCQPDRKRTQPKSERSTSIKRARRKLVESVLATTNHSETQPQVSEAGNILCNFPVPEETPQYTLEDTEAATALCNFSNNIVLKEPHVKSSCSQSVGIQCTPKFRSKFVQCDLLTKREIKYASTASSPIKYSPLLYNAPFDTEFCLNTSISASDTSSDVSVTMSGFSVSSTNSDVSWDSTDVVDENYRKKLADGSTYIVQKKSLFYLGIPEDVYFLVNLLLRNIKCTEVHIFVTLKKIRTNLPFQQLADDFGISKSVAGKYFNTTVDPIAKCLKRLIIWHHSDDIQQNLPIAFRSRYSNVQSIIDCFEIEIEKPTDPIKQSCTWSEYKKANTLKYLISSSPDGLVNYVSGGFGGRTSDMVIVEHCGYLNILPQGCSVMADRGFKRMDVILQPLNCTLVRPPSVAAGLKSTKEEVMQTKRIAALRIHIERVIRRLREFKILKPHSCINNKIIVHMDNIVIIASALINLQGALIKK